MASRACGSQSFPTLIADPGALNAASEPHRNPSCAPLVANPHLAPYLPPKRTMP